MNTFHEPAAQGRHRSAYRAGVSVALLTSFLTIWSTLVRDDGNGIGFFMLIMAAAVGAFAGEFRAAAMMRTMWGVAVMQMLLAVLVATEPSIAIVEYGSLKALSVGGISSVAWLVSAALFRVATAGAGMGRSGR